MIPKQFDAISKTDIDALIANEVAESKTLEYKQELPGGTDSDKKEFLAGVSSFGNGSGGDLIFGIKEAKDDEGKNTGLPAGVLPVTGTTFDQAKLRLEEIIRNGIEPRMPVQISEITGFGKDGKGFVLLLRIPRSIAAPHVVTFKGSFKFYARHSSGKYQLDVQELRSAFLATESQADRIKRFREARLGLIVADETPVRLSSPHRLVLHLIPIGSFLNDERLDLASVRPLALFNPLGGHGRSRFNLDGIVCPSIDADDGKQNDGYCQLFFNGVVETVSSSIVRGDLGVRISGGVGGIASVKYEHEVIQAINSYFHGYQQIGISAPVAISLALLGCRGSFLHVDQRIMVSNNPAAIDRDVAILPDVVVDSLDVNVAKALKPAFDAVWNACGYPRSFNYDDEGDWNPRR